MSGRLPGYARASVASEASWNRPRLNLLKAALTPGYFVKVTAMKPPRPAPDRSVGAAGMAEGKKGLRS